MLAWSVSRRQITGMADSSHTHFWIPAQALARPSVGGQHAALIGVEPE
jgi:hypothetical protein